MLHTNARGLCRDAAQPRTSLRGLTGSDYCPASSNRKKFEVINGHLIEPCLHPFHYHPAAGMGAAGGDPAARVPGASCGQAEGEQGINGGLQEDGIFSCMIFPLKEKNIHRETRKSQPRTRKAICNPLQGGRRCRVRLIPLTILY